MSHQPQVTTVPDPHVEQAPSSAFLTHCYRNALDRLESSYRDGRAAAVLIGEGKSASNFVIERFLSEIEEETAVVRISEPCTDAVHLMRKIVRAVGFEPKDMGLNDLESVFKMFLSFQKGHCRRTVLCMEEIQDSEWWVLDKIRHLVELEDEGKFGMLVIISGQPTLKELLHTRPLSSVCVLAGQRISLAPFTLTETTEFMRGRVDKGEKTALEQVFHFHAITLIHELCAGVPDAIGTLVDGCMQLADNEGLDLITIDQVKRAYESLRAGSADESDAEAATVSLTGMQPPPGHLVVQIRGEEAREQAVRFGHILIGRSKLCDIRIESSVVSRQHALISYSSEGTTLVDLSSTNGTYVDGYQIKTHKLEVGETIVVGDCKIEYVVDDAVQGSYVDVEQTSSLELPHAN